MGEWVGGGGGGVMKVNQLELLLSPWQLTTLSTSFNVDGGSWRSWRPSGVTFTPPISPTYRSYYVESSRSVFLSCP